MKTKLVTAVALAAGLLAVCTAVFAHHGDTVYDLTRVVVLKNAKVTDVLYANPHVLTYFDVTDKDGKVAHWVAEGNSPVNVARQGWKSGTLQAGDVITTVRIFQARDGKPVGRMGDFTLADGKVLESYGGSAHPSPGNTFKTDCNQKTVTGGFTALDCIGAGKPNDSK